MVLLRLHAYFPQNGIDKVPSANRNGINRAKLVVIASCEMWSRCTTSRAASSAAWRVARSHGVSWVWFSGIDGLVAGLQDCIGNREYVIFPFTDRHPCKP